MVQRLGPDRADDVVAALCDAFAGYPVMRHVLGPDTGNTTDRLATLVRLFVMARILRDEAMFGIPDGARLSGVAMVSVPGGEPPSALVELRERTWGLLGMDCRTRYEAFVAATAPFGVDTPHLHLNMIGVRREMQGRGFARPLLEAVHALCRSTPGCGGVSLTTEDPRNLALYERFGYTVIGHAVVAPELETWGMFRPV
jgi:GNAT superfamily N-acetyltransferase